MRNYFTFKKIRESISDLVDLSFVLMVILGVVSFILLILFFPGYILVKLLGL